MTATLTPPARVCGSDAARRGAWAAHLTASWRSAWVTSGALLGAFAGLLIALLAQLTHPLGVALLTAAGGH